MEYSSETEANEEGSTSICVSSDLDGAVKGEIGDVPRAEGGGANMADDGADKGETEEEEAA